MLFMFFPSPSVTSQPAHSSPSARLYEQRQRPRGRSRGGRVLQTHALYVKHVAVVTLRAVGSVRGQTLVQRHAVRTHAVRTRGGRGHRTQRVSQPRDAVPLTAKLLTPHGGIRVHVARVTHVANVPTRHVLVERRRTVKHVIDRQRVPKIPPTQVLVKRCTLVKRTIHIFYVQHVPPLQNTVEQRRPLKVLCSVVTRDTSHKDRS